MFAIKAEGTQIDTSTGYGKLNYYFCKYHFQIAEDVNKIKPETIAVIKNEESEAELANVKNQRKLDALTYYRNMTPEDMMKALQILGYSSRGMSINLAQSKLFDFINKSDNNVELFYSMWVENNNKETQYILSQAVQFGVVTKNKTTYKYGTDVIGTSEEDAIDYLKDKANKDLLIAIQKGIEVKTSI